MLVSVLQNRYAVGPARQENAPRVLRIECVSARLIRVRVCELAARRGAWVERASGWVRKNGVGEGNLLEFRVSF